jgi:hypothetical protein
MNRHPLKTGIFDALLLESPSVQALSWTVSAQPVPDPVSNLEAILFDQGSSSSDAIRWHVIPVQIFKQLMSEGSFRRSSQGRGLSLSLSHSAHSAVLNPRFSFRAMIGSTELGLHPLQNRPAPSLLPSSTKMTSRASIRLNT